MGYKETLGWLADIDKNITYVRTLAKTLYYFLYIIVHNSHNDYDYLVGESLVCYNFITIKIDLSFYIYFMRKIVLKHPQEVIYILAKQKLE